MVTLISLITTGIQTGTPSVIITALADFLPILLIATIALVFGILNYRTNKKILKKLEEKKGDG